MNTFTFAWKWLEEEPHQQNGIRMLQIAIGSMLLFRVFTEARFAAYLWGPAGLGRGSSVALFGTALGTLLDRIFHIQAGAAAVIVVLGVSALGLVLGYRTRFATALALLVLTLLEQRLQDLPDGGDNIARLVLCYMVFLIPHGTKWARGSLAVWVHNVAVLAIGLQIAVLYSTAGLAKAYGNLWHHGTAMYYIGQVQWFSLPAMRGVLKNPAITTMATYLPVLYQVWFPLAIISPLRRPWLAIGMLFHLGIAVFMGLISFSTVMIGLDLIFISDSEYARMGEVAYRFRRSSLDRVRVICARFYEPLPANRVVQAVKREP